MYLLFINSVHLFFSSLGFIDASMCDQTRNMTAEEEMRVAEQRRALRAAMEELSNIEQTMTHVLFHFMRILCRSLYFYSVVYSTKQDSVSRNCYIN